jgi:predicted ATPase
MIFDINNLGMIKTAHFEVSKLTAISGNNGSGKSFLGKCYISLKI